MLGIRTYDHLHFSSMRDTMTIALQLHREAKTFMQGRGNVSVQDIELHRRLLQVGIFR